MTGTAGSNGYNAHMWDQWQWSAALCLFVASSIAGGCAVLGLLSRDVDAGKLATGLGFIGVALVGAGDGMLFIREAIATDGSTANAKLAALEAGGNYVLALCCILCGLSFVASCLHRPGRE